MPELERQLRALGDELALPPTPDLAGAVAARVRTSSRERAWRSRRSVAIAVAVLGLALAAALAVPPARSAFLDLLGIGGVEIERVETLPVAPEDADLALGDRIAVGDASRAADYPVLVPSARGVRAYVDPSVPGAKLAFTWREDGRRLLLFEFRGRVLVEKEVGPDTPVVETTVRGVRALWIAGRSHVVVWRDANGRIREETRRLAGNVLLWERRGVTYRLEGARTRAQALAAARSLR